MAGTPAPAITFGHSKDHRPDLKQLVFISTVSADQAVPVIYRLASGNTSDDPTHIPTWDTPVKLTGGPGFLYVADCKAALEEAMGHIHRAGVSRTRGWTMPSFSWPGPGLALLAGRVLRDVRLAPRLQVLTITIMLIVMISVWFGR